MAVDGVVVATSNAGKLREVRAILADLEVPLLAPDAFAPLRFPEEGDDYEENAAAKARTCAQATGCLSLGDDSGLEVEALGGRPGVRSARYGGPGLDDAARVARLLEELRGVSEEKRAARFVCVAALAHPDGRVVTARGSCEGRILDAPRGSVGFGYDPVFLAAGGGLSMAEIPESEKNRLSHRARAFRALRGHIDAALRG